MEDRPTTSKPAISSSPSPSANPDIKSPTSRPLYSSKLGDQRGRTTEATASPQSAARQTPVQQKAWTSNRNPITGRQQIPQNKQFVTNSLREGQRVRIVLASGAEFEGTYSNGPEPTSCRLTMVQQKKLPNSSDIANGPARREQTAMTFQRKEITEARVVSGNATKNDGRTTNGNRSSFRTDAAISNSRPGAERALKAWVPDTGYEVDGSLEKSSNTGVWDQFAENERLFGLKTDYDENIYTTVIDKSHPQYKERLAAAERKAREIEGSVATTAHVAEERVMDFVGGEDQRDEEDKYSGVRRQDFPPLASRENKYTPPARRAPTGQATVKGAPVDPAIISSQLKGAPAPKQPSPKPVEPKHPTTAEKPATPSTDKPAEVKTSGKPAEAKTGESKVDATSVKAGDDKDAAPIRPSAATSRVASHVKPGAAPSATSTVERDVLVSFKSFASSQRTLAERTRTTKAKADKEVKLTELKKFADSFKLSTPVPKDLISIIAKDPAKQKQIQEKAQKNAEEMARQKAAEAAAKEAAAAKESQAKVAAEQSSTSTTAAGTTDARAGSRPTAPQHSGSPAGIPGRHPGARSSYNPQHYQQYNRNGRGPPHMAPQNQPTGNLAQRLRTVEQQKLQHPHMTQPDMRLPPTGPANSADPSFGRRVSAVPPSYLGPKLNPNSHEFRPNAFAQPFNPAIPSQGSSPRSSVNNVVETPIPPPPAKGQLIRRKTMKVDIKKCFILSHIESIQPPQGRHWDDNDGIRPSFDTLPTWRQLQEETEAPDSTMHLTYKEYFERLPLSAAAVATPNPTHVMPQIAHQHQLPFHLQHGAQNLAPRQSPHMPPMQMHTGQHGHVPHVPFSNPDDHRMMHSTSAQSFASPRMGQVPMAYPPAMSAAPAQMPYGQPVMQPYVNPAPQMGQFRSFSNNPQFIPQQPHHMAAPMMVQPQFIPGPNGMVTAGPMYAGAHAQFIPAGAVPPQPMAGSNGFPSPGRPAAPMMVHQGSHQGAHQGQQPVYAMSPGMGYQQPAYTPQQPQGKFSGQRPQ
ncbi:poly(A)-binding protein binding protein [Madurella fahalii]|uniref:Poly(A)-binding protein binding protein n=1 Tax=Madurella fahalii TaxID=1157608 RepID=A0ABQ0G544_9PEZI